MAVSLNSRLESNKEGEEVVAGEGVDVQSAKGGGHLLGFIRGLLGLEHRLRGQLRPARFHVHAHARHLQGYFFITLEPRVE